MFLHVYIAPGQGQTKLFVDKTLMSTEKPGHFAHLLQVSKNILKSDFIHNFHVFIHVYSPGQGQTTPWGQNFYVNIYRMPLWSFAVSFFPLNDFLTVFPYKSIKDQI